jgi:hypothetical protein
MDEFLVEAVGRKHAMPSKEEVARIRSELWSVCANDSHRWNLSIPFSEFKFRKRDNSDPVFRRKDFESADHTEQQGPGKGGLDLLGRYRLKDSLVTIYVDSCRKVERWCDVALDQLVRVVLVHELAHLMTHRGFGAQKALSAHFWEYTAQCATYAYLYRHDQGALSVFKKLSPYQPFIYQTWESLEALHASTTNEKFNNMIKEIFSAVAADPVDKSTAEREGTHDIVGYDE